MNSMTSATYRTVTDLPSWQTAPCPSWCTWAPHREDELPEDRRHAGTNYRRALSLERPAEVETGRYEPETVGVYLWQHVREIEPTVMVCKGESCEGFRLTLEDAEVLAGLLEGVVAEARSGSGVAETAATASSDALDIERGVEHPRSNIATAVSCPSWCTSGSSEYPCYGDHADDKVFVPATGATRPTVVDAEGGAAFPVVGVGLDWAEVDGRGTSLVLWSTGVGDDHEVYFQPWEAQKLVAELTARLAVLPRRQVTFRG